LGIGYCGLGIGPNPQSPIPNPQSPIPILKNQIDIKSLYIYIYVYIYINNIITIKNINKFHYLNSIILPKLKSRFFSFCLLLSLEIILFELKSKLT